MNGRPGRRTPARRVPARSTRFFGGGRFLTPPAHVRAQPPVALKVLLPNVARDQRSLRDFAEEVALLSTLKHPHIVACYGAGLRPAGTAPGASPVPFLCMEAVTGSDLRSLVTRATMEPGVYTAADVMRWAYQMSSALNHLHTRSPMVIYRDLKLENVMLTGAHRRLPRGKAPADSLLWAGSSQSTGTCG